MATQIKRIPENRNTRTSVTISGPAYMVAVGGSPRGAKAKPPKNTITSSQLPIAEEYHNVLPRYLRPSTGSCHDRCKHGMRDDTLELKRPTRRLGSRKMPVVKNRGNRTVDPLNGKKTTKTTPKHSSNPKFRAPTQAAKANKREPSKKVGALKHNLPTKRMATNHVKTKPISAERVIPKPRNHKLVHRQKDQTKMTKEKLRQLIAKKVQEMTKMRLLDAETAEFVTPTVEMIESALTAEPTNLYNSENSRSSSEEQVLSDAEHADNEDVECEDNNEMETSEDNEDNNELETSEDNEDNGKEVKFRRGRILELESEDNGPKKLTFRRGRVLDNGEDDDSEKVNLKHQEQEEKEAQELLNRVIEETATKLAEDRKTKVGALVGAFETVISLQPSSDVK